jgi:hypothetical protein
MNVFDKAPDEPPEQYADLPERDDLVDETEGILSRMTDTISLALMLEKGNVPDPGTTVEQLYPGETKAQALGRAYAIRDRIQDAGGSCEAEYIEPVWLEHNVPQHKIVIRMHDEECDE